MAETIKAMFGPADFIFNKGDQENEIRFDGKNRLQFEGGEVVLEPQYAEITSVDTGGGAYDDYFTHYVGTITISGFQDDLEAFKLALGGLQEITDSAGGGVKGYADAPVGQSNRERGHTLDIAPRGLMEQNTGEHIHIYKTASTASYTRTYGAEQGAVSIELKIYPKDGADFAKGDNFFRRGQDSIMPWFEQPAS